MAASADVAQFEAVEEWNLWKEEHGKKYLTYKVSVKQFFYTLQQNTMYGNYPTLVGNSF